MPKSVIISGNWRLQPLRVERSTYEPPYTHGIDRGPDWMRDPTRGCSPENGDDGVFTSENRGDTAQAERICQRRCPFLTECDTWATEHNEQHHVWGGRLRTRDRNRKDAEA